MNHSYCLIMSGGIGGRLWPMSKKEKPKQFLDVFKTGRSLIQQTFDRCKQVVSPENIFVCTNELYATITKKQLPELKEDRLLLEPMRRNTAPCIVYSSYRILLEDRKANLIVCPSDHLIVENGYFITNIKKGLEFVEKFPFLLTIGVKPTHLETEYGYIQAIANQINSFQRVKTFTEKPNDKLAKMFHQCDNFFWNSGIFLWNIRTILESIKTYLPEMNNLFSMGIHQYNTKKEKEFLHKVYFNCPNLSIDHGIIEKAKNVYMLKADFEWHDLGSWKSFFIFQKRMNKEISYRSI